ncbi:DgyrCDS8865 [Dimorphilus gyrociliatus]|uniref:DgyrCDS8865 n=1 Tax=Dimorphilus gyrociliatus TaxID=2664684 RepID=A0A7I8VWW5_9ANNE|nr:DgyrCDS8865 [Dimorphilus gyrociliatus]
MPKQRHKSGESTFSQDSISYYIPTPPDGGYGWIIVLASFLNHVIVDGICFTSSNFLSEFKEHFKSGEGTTTLASSLLCGGYLLAGPIASALTNKFGCRSVCVTGSIFTSASFLIASFSPNIQILILTYGLMGGIGFGLIYLPSVIAVSYYFDRKRALATGIAVCGAGVGTFIFAPLGNALIKHLGWKNALRVIAAIVLLGIFSGLLLRPLEPVKSKPRRKNVFDRLCERIRVSRRKEKPTEENDEKIAEKVQEAKLMREARLRVEDSEQEVSSLPSLIVNKEPPTTQSNGHVPTINVEAIEKEPKTVSFTKAAVANGVDEEKNELLLTKPQNGTKSLSENHLAVPKPKLRKPQGVHREDYARPMYRQDIFYSGSIMHIANFTSQPNMGSYVASITAIPAASESGKDSFFAKVTSRIPKPVFDVLKEMFNFKMLSNKRFAMVCLANVLGMIGLYVPFIYMKARCLPLGINDEKSSLLLSVIGITNTLGRVISGWLADLKSVDPLLLHNVAILVAGAVSIISTFFKTYALMTVFAAIFGLSVATWISLTSITLCELVGLEKLTNGFGILTMLRGIAIIGGVPLVGEIYEKFKLDVTVTYHIGGSSLIVAAFAVMLLFLPCFKRERSLPEMTEEEIEEIFVDLDPTQNECFMNNGKSIDEIVDTRPSNGVIVHVDEKA